MKKPCPVAIFVRILGVLAFLSVSTHARSEPTVDTFVAQLDKSMRSIHAQANGKADRTRAGCRDLLSRLLALDVMARATVSDAWDKMTDSQRDSFRSAFAERMASACVRGFSDYDGDEIKLVGVRSPKGGDILASVRFGTEDDNSKRITWRLRQVDGETWRAVDVILEGRSAVLTAQEEFAAVLQSQDGDIEALIASMRK
jgi:ABC-type transporter MlaC component